MTARIDVEPSDRRGHIVGIENHTRPLLSTVDPEQPESFDDRDAPP